MYMVYIYTLYIHIHARESVLWQLFSPRGLILHAIGLAAGMHRGCVGTAMRSEKVHVPTGLVDSSC